MNRVAYQVPDRERAMYDFYALTYMSQTVGEGVGKGEVDGNLVDKIDNAATDIVIFWYNTLIKEMPYILAAEISHTTNQASPKVDDEGEFIPDSEYIYDRMVKIDKIKAKDDYRYLMYHPSKERGGDYAETYQQLLKTFKDLKSLSFSQFAMDVFCKLDWGDLGYGGKAWCQIAKAYDGLVKAKSWNEIVRSIDIVFHAEHNNGVAFDKLRTFGNDLSWIRKALNFKRRAKDIKDFFPVVSSEVRGYIKSLSGDTSLEFKGQKVTPQYFERLVNLLGGRFEFDDDEPQVTYKGYTLELSGSSIIINGHTKVKLTGNLYTDAETIKSKTVGYLSSLFKDLKSIPGVSGLVEKGSLIFFTLKGKNIVLNYSPGVQLNIFFKDGEHLMDYDLEEDAAPTAKNLIKDLIANIP